LEELRRELNESKDAIAIAITFNCNSDYHPSNEQYISENSAANILLSIFQRILSAAGAYSFDEFGELASQLDPNSLDTPVKIKRLAFLFFKCFVVKISVNRNKPLKSFTLLIDEIVHVFNEISEIDSNFTMKHFEYTLSTVKSAMLDTSCFGQGKYVLLVFKCLLSY